MKVKILFVTVYKRRAQYREVWQGDRLISYDARTDDNGDLYETTARTEGDEMIVDGVNGTVRVPLDTVSTHPWNIAAVDRPLLFGQRDGKLRKVEVEQAKPESIEIDGKRIEAQKYVVSGELERELFYDADGTWLQWRLERDGKTVTITKRGLDRSHRSMSRWGRPHVGVDRYLGKSTAFEQGAHPGEDVDVHLQEEIDDVDRHPVLADQALVMQVEIHHPHGHFAAGGCRVPKKSPPACRARTLGQPPVTE